MYKKRKFEKLVYSFLIGKVEIRILSMNATCAISQLFFISYVIKTIKVATTG